MTNLIPTRLHRLPTRPAALLVTIATVALGQFASPASAQLLPPPPPKIDRDATATFDWSVPARYNASWEAWRPSDAKYEKDFLNPAGYKLILNACGSRSVRPVERYTFAITGLTAPGYRRTLEGPTCQQTLRNLTLGLYRVETTLHTAMGQSVTIAGVANVRDYLIVAVGDSLMSGEGVPDEPGQYKLGGNLEAVEIRPARWKDRRCHRSALSGPALAAKAIEDADRFTSVTFLSFACSGADLIHLYAENYDGAVDTGATQPLPPQLTSVRNHVGNGAYGQRKIDALLIGAGINDLRFSDIIVACGTNLNVSSQNENCVDAFGGFSLVRSPGFAVRYDWIAAAIRLGLDVRETYLNDYPAEIFAGGGCSVAGVQLIDSNEGDQMGYLGRLLNQQIRQSTERHRDEGWNFAEDLALPFAGHGYCANETWFNKLQGSLSRQGDVLGTAHPNPAGHREFARLLGKSIVPNQPQTPYRVAKLQIDALKLTASGTGTETRNVELALERFPRDDSGPTRQVSVPRNGQWTPVPDDIGTFSIDLFRTPASPRHATKVRMMLDSSLPIDHGYSDGYGAGVPRELAHPTGKLAVRYHIDVSDPSDTGYPNTSTDGGLPPSP